MRLPFFYIIPACNRETGAPDRDSTVYFELKVDVVIRTYLKIED